MSLFETALFHSAIEFKPRLGRMGDVLSDIKMAADAAMQVLNAYLVNECTQAGVAAAQCASFSQQATLLQTQLNNAFFAGDLITLGLVANQIYNLNKDVKDAIDAAKQVPAPAPGPAPTPASGGTSPWVYVAGGVGILGVVGLIIYGVTR